MTNKQKDRVTVKTRKKVKIKIEKDRVTLTVKTRKKVTGKSGRDRVTVDKRRRTDWTENPHIDLHDE